ncbi:hypothetical protein EGH73_01025 [Epilithonimonas hominis]|uniref:Uncharacterized protein n=2 Tax=Epilithonimonas hominis TaxID=420404 RepID=A0A3N0XBR3_9FLAO|nr:hypothetical protein EGH73_01025 [Epilithonimonas hominis]
MKARLFGLAFFIFLNMIEIKKFKFVSNLDFVCQSLKDKGILFEADWENNILYCEEKDKQNVFEFINSLNLDENEVEVDESVIAGYKEWDKNMYNPGHFTGGHMPFFDKEKNNYALYGWITIMSGIICLIEIVNAKEFRKSVFWFDVMITILISFSFFYQHYKFKKTRK